MRKKIKKCILWMLAMNIGYVANAQTPLLWNPALVNRFYQLHQQPLFWFCHAGSSQQLRKSLRIWIDSAAYWGLDKSDYHDSLWALASEESSDPKDSLELLATDRILTDAAIHFLRDIYCGAHIGNQINADQISAKFEEKDNDSILSGILRLSDSASLNSLIISLEPHDREYESLKKTLRDSMSTGNPAYVRALAQALNLHRWIRHFDFDQYVIVNVPSATLRYYQRDSLAIRMKVVVGKPSTRTPRFAAYCNEIILYPYWNVPRKIVTKELLPLFKRFPRMVDSMNMQITDAQGNIVDHQKLRWNDFTKDNFPYLVRQSTGCDNALGVMKFNLTSPYDVYMHDTNLKSAFSSRYRFYSHGCIRLEKPLELAKGLLTTTLDTNYLQSCLRDQKPKPILLAKPVPVFVIYATVEALEPGSLQFYRDVYALNRPNVFEKDHEPL